MTVRYLTIGLEPLIEFDDGLFCPVDFLQPIEE